MATVTKLKAAVNNKNLPILGLNGNLYSYYYGNYFNKIVEKGYTPTLSEKEALEAFIQDGVNNGWIDIVDYFLPLIGDSTHLSAATVPLIDNIGNYAMEEYDGTEDFSNSFEVNSVNNKIKYYHRAQYTSSQLKSPCTVSSMNGGISFSGYIPTPEVFTVGDTYNDYYASIGDENKYFFGIRFSQVPSGTKYHTIGYLKNTTDTAMTHLTIGHPSREIIEYLNEHEKSLIVSYALYKKDGAVKRLRGFLDEVGNKSFENSVPPGDEVQYPDYSYVTNKMIFGSRTNLVPEQKFGCIAVLNAPIVTETKINYYNSAVYTLMIALGK